MNRRRRGRKGPAEPWSRERLQAAMVVVFLAVVVLVAGLGVAVWQALQPAAEPTSTPSIQGVVSEQVVRDRIAAEPMLVTSREDAVRGEPALVQPDAVVIPEPSVPRGPAGVPTGFPRTPEGAVGQLAAIETTVLEGMDVATVRQVHAEWVSPGGPEFGGWVLTQAVRSFLGAAGEPGSRSDRAVVKATPAASIVKGTDGPDWVLACVLLDVRAQLVQKQARVGFGHCERMTRPVSE